MATVNPYLSISILNINGLNSPIKMHTIIKQTNKKHKQKTTYNYL